MDIASSLEHSFEQQCFLQLDRLKKELLEEEEKMKENRKAFSRQRLFPNNIYEEMSAPRKQYYEKILAYTLKSLGESIHNNLKAAARPTGNQPTSTGLRTSAHNALLVVDRSLHTNYHFDAYGVLHLKPKNHVKFASIVSRRVQGLILHIIVTVLKLLQSGNYMTKRQLYYGSLKFLRVQTIHRSQSQSQRSQNPNSQSQTSFNNNSSQNYGFNNWRQSQNNSQPQSQQNSQSRKAKYCCARLDRALNHICCLVGCSKVHLHILPQTKGILYGDLRFELKTGEEFNCLSKKEGTALPSPHNSIVKLESNAKFVLIIEKDSVLQNILNQEEGRKFIESYKAIAITGRGYPDINTRAFVNFLWSKLRLPTLALTDADPHGFEILCSYKFGNYTTAFEGSNICLPQIKWLGLLPGDVKRLSIQESNLLTLSEADVKKLGSLIVRPNLKNNEAYQRQLSIMLESNRKAEIESLDAENDYLVKIYLPNKLRHASWL